MCRFIDQDIISTSFREDPNESISLHIELFGLNTSKFVRFYFRLNEAY